MPKIPIRTRLANAIIGKQKSYIPALSMFDGLSMEGTGRMKNYASRTEALGANVGWCFTANTAIVDPCSAVELKLFRKKKDGDKEEVMPGDPGYEIIDLLKRPNMMHTGEQFRQLHFTYMNFVGESYIYMMKNGKGFVPAKGQLPDALHTFPAHMVQFQVGHDFTSSTVRFNGEEFPLFNFIRDINPDPANPYRGRSIIAAAAAILDTEYQMKEWNRRLFVNNARPSLIFNTNEPLSDEAYERWRQQFTEEKTGTDNAYKPLLIEGGDAKPYMLSQQDLDFLESRRFSRDEILAMFRVNPYMLGSVENVNLATARAARIQHAEMNVEPRLRQFVEQINATLVNVYDSSLELGFENPVPEDIEAKLQTAIAGVDKWMTKDEVRDMYGEEPLPGGLGSQIIVLGKGAATLKDVVNGEVEPEDTAGDEDLTDDDPGEDDELETKSLNGVKKKS
jgi:HK97 family phage portal protein